MNSDKGWRCAYCVEHRPRQRPNTYPWGVTYCLDCGRTRASELEPDAEYDRYIEQRVVGTASNPFWTYDAAYLALSELEEAR